MRAILRGFGAVAILFGILAGASLGQRDSAQRDAAVRSRTPGSHLSPDLGSQALPADLLRTISREEINGLPIRRYEGQVRLVASTEDLDRAMEDIRAERVLGFDTETRPAFRKGEHHLPRLVQAATARAVYLFPWQRMDRSAAVAEFLVARDTVKIGVSLAHDLRELKLVFPLEEASMLD